MKPTAGQASRPMFFATLAVLALGFEVLGWLAGRLGLAGWLVAAAAALLAAAAGLGRWQAFQTARQEETDRLRSEVARLTAFEDALANRAERQRKLRHDLRGVLSPALLTADRLLNNEDPKVKRAGEMMVLAVERASALMADE